MCSLCEWYLVAMPVHLQLHDTKPGSSAGLFSPTVPPYRIALFQNDCVAVAHTLQHTSIQQNTHTSQLRLASLASQYMSTAHHLYQHQLVHQLLRVVCVSVCASHAFCRRFSGPT